MARLASNHELRREVEAATRLGISLRRWSGWEPRRVTSTDEHGRTVTTTEPEWGDDERAWVLALLELEAQRCPGCGGHLPDTTSADHEGRYAAGPPLRCHRCSALHQRQDDYRDDPNRAAQVVWPVRLRT